jgi:hypothetical protein
MNKYKVAVIETSYWYVTVEGETESIAADNAVVLFQENYDSLSEVGDEYVPGFLEAQIEGRVA